MAKSYESFDRPYRRGLVLGLSLAELFLILLFLLLLIATGISETNKKDKIELNELRDQLQAIYEKVGNDIKIEDFRKLAESAAEVLRLNTVVETLKDELSGLEQKLKEYERLSSTIEEYDISPEVLNSLIRDSEDIIDLQNQLADKNSQLEKFRENIDKLEYENKQITEKNKELTIDLESARNAVAMLSEVKGENPPCWFRNDKNRQRHVKLFDIKIQDDGLVVRVHDNSAYQKSEVNYGKLEALPSLNGINFDILYNRNTFLNNFKPYKEAGEQSLIQSYKCSFTVDVFDATSKENKAGYKFYMGTIKQLFSVYLENDQW